MSSIEMKIDRLENAPSFPSVQTHRDEIDLLDLMSTLYTAKKQIIATVLFFALCGLAVSYLLPQKWTSTAIVTLPEGKNVIALRRAIVNLTVLGVESKIDADNLYNLFLKKFDSQELREQFLTQSPYVQALVKNADVDKSKLYNAIVNVSRQFTAVDNSDPKKSNNPPYASWTLSFTAPDAHDAQQVLQSYIQFITTEVKKDILTRIKNAVDLKIAFEKNSLALERGNLENQHDINVARLGYSLQVANAAGLKNPVYSNGMVIKDDPDYSVSLGANGLAEKLKIEQSIKDVAQLNASVQNRENILAQLQTIHMGDVEFTPYQIQMQPSLPIKSNGPGKGLIVVLSALIGLIVAAGLVLLRSALASRIRSEQI